MTPQLWINVLHALALSSLRHPNPKIQTVVRVYIGREARFPGWVGTMVDDGVGLAEILHLKYYTTPLRTYVLVDQPSFIDTDSVQLTEAGSASWPDHLTEIV